MEITNETIEFLAGITPGNVSIYRFDGTHFTTLYISPSLPRLNGMTMEEYRRYADTDICSIGMPEDIPGLMAAVENCIRTKTPLDYYFRVVHKTLGYDWAHICARVCGHQNGQPIILAVYTNASVDNDVYQKILDHSDNMAYVCDVDTLEILYANRAAQIRQEDMTGIYHGQKCYAYIHGKTSPCEDCFLKDLHTNEVTKYNHFNSNRSVWEQITAERINWCGHDAFVQYIVNITDMVEQQNKMRGMLEDQKSLVDAVRILDGTDPVEERLNKMLRHLGEHCRADRAYIFEIKGQVQNNTYEWCRSGNQPEIDTL